jgi:hypothetical protein
MPPNGDFLPESTARTDFSFTGKRRARRLRQKRDRESTGDMRETFEERR